MQPTDPKTLTRMLESARCGEAAAVEDLPGVVAGRQFSAELDLVDLGDTLERPTRLNPRHGRLVELRVLGGPTSAETASLLEVSESTVEREWPMAEVSLRSELEAPR